VTGELQALATLPPEKTRYPLNGRIGGPKSCSGHLWRREKSLALTRIKPQATQLVGQSLHWLHYPCSSS